MVTQVESEVTLNRLMRDEGITLSRYDPTAPLSFASMNSVFERAARLTGDAVFGFRVGMGMQPEDYGPFVDYAMAAPRLDQALRRLCGMSMLQTNALTFDVGEEGEKAVWRISYHVSGNLARHQHALHILPAMVRGLCGYLGDRMAGPVAEGLSLQVALSHAPSVAMLEEGLGFPVRSAADRYALVFPKAWLGVRPEKVRPSNLTFCDVYNRYFPRLPRTMAEAVTLVIEPRMANGTVPIEEVARLLGVSRRKLQSDLNAEGHLYRDLLRGLRAQRAMRLMRETTNTLAEIALSVGYSDQAHFHRAFLAVSGMAPGEWRAGRRGKLPMRNKIRSW